MAQIGWTHHRTLLDSFADQPGAYTWYASKASENGCSVRQLKGQIDLQLHQRQGAALTNFERVLEPADAEPALQATKDPYVFDFLELSEDIRQRQLEQALIDDIQKLLLELGTGFAFSGRQKPIVVGGEEFFLDPALLPPRPAALRDHRAQDRQGPARARRQHELLSQRGRRTTPTRRRSRKRGDHPLHRPQRNGRQARAAPRLPIAVSTWRTDRPPRELPAVEITENIPADLDELAELGSVRQRLIDRVAQRAQIIDEGATKGRRHHGRPVHRRRPRAVRPRTYAGVPVQQELPRRRWRAPGPAQEV